MGIITSKMLQEEFMQMTIRLAKAFGINCTVTTDAGTQKYNVDSDCTHVSDTHQTIISKELKEMIMVDKKDRSKLTFADLYRRMVGRYSYTKVPIGNDANENHMKNKGCHSFNDWSYTFENQFKVTMETKRYHHILRLYAKSNKYTDYYVFHAVISINATDKRCIISLVFNEPPCHVYDNYIDISTNIADIDKWAFTYRNNDLVLSLVSKLLKLAES